MDQEKWIKLDRSMCRRCKDTIIELSDHGRYRRIDGSIGVLNLRHQIRLGDRTVLASHIIADNFLITVKRPDQVDIDHITHTPNGINVQDIRNLRYCTHKENMNFEERKDKLSKSLVKFNEAHRDGLSPHWTNTPSLRTIYNRAWKAYKRGKVSYDEMKKARTAYKEEKRARKLNIA